MDNTVYLVPLVVIALAGIDTAISGKFRPFRNSKKNWSVPKWGRWLVGIVGALAAGIFVLIVK